MMGLTGPRRRSKLDDQRESDQVEDRRGGGMMAKGGIGLGTVVLALVAWCY